MIQYGASKSEDKKSAMHMLTTSVLVAVLILNVRQKASAMKEFPKTETIMIISWSTAWPLLKTSLNLSELVESFVESTFSVSLTIIFAH